MPRKRSPENEGLPKRWSFRRNSYYYQVPPGQDRKWDGKKLFKLGKTLPEAYKIWASCLESIDNSKSIDDLFDRYELEILPTKSNSTQYLYRLYIKTPRPVFGHMDKDDIEPFEIYKYLNERSKKKLIDGKERGGIPSTSSMRGDNFHVEGLQ